MNSQLLKKVFNQKTLFGFMFISMAATTVYVAVRLILAPETTNPDAVDIRAKSDYLHMLLQCGSGTIALLLPSIVAKKFKIVIPSSMVIAYAAFLYAAVYLGDIHRMYFIIPQWDTILHTLSGVMLGMLGFTLVSFLNKTDRVPVVLSPAFVAVFTFCFSVALGALWEVYEFTMDQFLNMNLQRYALEHGADHIGRTAVVDTMTDLIVCCIGALVFAVISYLNLKRGSDDFMKSLTLKKLEAAKSHKGKSGSARHVADKKRKKK